MRVLLDYRSALRERSGVGEYAHQLGCALLSAPGQHLALTLFSSSWKDRVVSGAELAGVDAVDRRIPGRLAYERAIERRCA